MRKSLRIILCALAVYLLLLWLLVAAEAASPAASIGGFWDAVWYSLITVTTVGYGDLFPVTPAGRLLGLVFALCSVGLLSALIGLTVSLVGGQFLPRLRLRGARARRWYAFSAENADSAALAACLRREDPDSLLIFPAGEEKTFPGEDAVRLDADVRQLLKLRGGRKEDLVLFAMGADRWDNYRRALEAAEIGLRVCCMADPGADSLPPELTLFSRKDCLSRCYWKERPLGREERCVVLIGCGEVGGALLERALLTNVFEAGRAVEYHVFGDWADFAALHPRTVEDLSSGAPGEDLLKFHEEAWTRAGDLLRRADRILVCADREEDNLAVCRRLNTWFPVPAALHAALDAPVPGLDSFGCREEMLTPEYVMKDAVNRRAMLLHRVYSEGADAPVPWRELREFTRRSNVAAADHLIVKIRILLGDDGLREADAGSCRRAWEVWQSLSPEEREPLLELEHRRWVRFHRLYNWEYAPVRDDTRRLHPMLLPYAELSREDQLKDAFAWEMLGRLAEQSDPAD